MAKHRRPPVTSAIRALRAAKVSFEPHFYTYQSHGGTSTSSSALGVEEAVVIKTIVLQDQDGAPLIVLMHGHLKVSTGKVARYLGVKKVQLCSHDAAQKHSGYLVGGTSPFGTKKKMRVLAETSIQDLPRLFINGGKRGFLISLQPNQLIKALPSLLEWGTFS